MKLYYTQTEPLAQRHQRALTQRGYQPVQLAFRRIERLAVDRSLADCDLLVVTSKHAARWLAQHEPSGVPPVAAVGRATHAELQGYRLIFGDDPPANAAALVAALRERAVEPTRCLFLQGEHALPTVPAGLPGIQTCVVYRSVAQQPTLATLASRALLYFQSPRTVYDFLNHFARTPDFIAAIGPSTAEAVRARGLKVDFQPSRPETAQFAAECPAPRYFHDKTGGQPEPRKETR